MRFRIGWSEIFLLLAITGVLGLGYLSLDTPGDKNCSDCNIVYISVEPLNAESMGLYGNTRNTTPNIDRLAEDSYVFDRAFAQHSHTTPSTFSTLSSTYPSQHGLSPGEKPPADTTLLPEVLQDRGFHTLALRESKIEDVVNRGFDVKGTANRTRWDEQYRFIEDQIDTSDEKFFLYYQSSYTHDPYFMNDEYTELYGPDIYKFRNESRRKFQEMSQDLPPEEFYPRFRDYYFSEAKMNETRRDFIKSQYDASVRRTDVFVGRMIQLLKERGEYQNTIIIINSQHGEQFGSQGRWRHDTSLYNEVTQVPLIVHLPSQNDKVRIEKYVENIDLAPTLLALTGENRMEKWEGDSLLPIFNGERFSKEFILSERGGGERAFIDPSNDIKYYRKGGSAEFYDLKQDFDEEHSLRKERYRAVQRTFEETHDKISSDTEESETAWPPLFEQVDERGTE